MFYSFTLRIASIFFIFTMHVQAGGFDATASLLYSYLNL